MLVKNKLDRHVAFNRCETIPKFSHVLPSLTLGQEHILDRDVIPHNLDRDSWVLMTVFPQIICCLRWVWF